MTKQEIIQFIEGNGFAGFSDMEISKRKICIFIESQLRPAIIQNTYPDSHHSYAKGLIPQKGEAVMDGDEVVITSEYSYRLKTIDGRDWTKTIRLWKEDGMVKMSIYQSHLQALFQYHSTQVIGTPEYDSYDTNESVFASEMAMSHYEIRGVDVPEEDNVVSSIDWNVGPDEVELYTVNDVLGGAEVIKTMWKIENKNVLGIPENLAPDEDVFGNSIKVVTDLTDRRKNVAYALSPEIKVRCIVQWKNSIGVVRNNIVEKEFDFSGHLERLDYLGLIEDQGFEETEFEGLT